MRRILHHLPPPPTTHCHPAAAAVGWRWF